MKKNFFLSAFAALVLFSCSNDEDDSGMDSLAVSPIVGTWLMTDVQIEEENSTQLNLFEEIVDALNAESCALLTFEFDAEGSVTATDKISFLEVNSGPTGLDVPCPTQSDTETSVWRLEGDQLTFINEDLEEETITVQIDGDTMVVAGNEFDDENLTEATIIFTKQ
ncbi:lipocalin family protein [Flavobacterium sp. ASW18X]|uniref:lipocalin family protein n=1 Tax=Flavobacterium sp. ASW18X TaxID=2572595 RepID=UPI0010AE27B4|nr:lipocalin family protein [Flavobacterium sp. ASW18X]TKD66602.1 hypothetical protein FBT53_01735 [Flavobacterium sp. ASW18X]